MSADWVLAAAPGFERDGGGVHGLNSEPLRMTEDFGADVLEALEAAVGCAPNPLAAVREAKAWREMLVSSQGSGGKTLPSVARARHCLALVGCCPLGELEDAFPALARELLGLLRRGEADNTRAVALAAVDEALRRLLQTPAPGSVGRGGRGGAGGGGSKAGAEVGGARQAVLSVLPKLVPAVTACLEGSTGADGASSVPPPLAVAAAALGVLEALVFLLRSTMRPHVKRVEGVTALWLQGPDDVIRDRAAAVLASLPLCGEEEAWTQAAGRVTLEAHGLLQVAWPDDDVDMGSDMGPSQLEAALSARGGLLPPLAVAPRGFTGSQQEFAALVIRRFKGLCRVLELMLLGDSNGRPVAVPVPLILALVERIQRMTPIVKPQGQQAFIPVAQGALSHGALHVIRPALVVAASRILGALATTAASTVLRNGRRFCRTLVQGMARQSAAGTLRAAGYRSIERGMLQLGAGAASYLATPALPALLAEVRAVIAASSPSDTSASTKGTADGAAIAAVAAGRASGTAVSAAGKGGGMRVEPAMSARKSSQKKQRRSREKEMGRALAAADAASTASAASSSNSGVGGNGGVGGRGGAMWSGAASEAEREAACAALSCLAQLVLCCKGHLPLGGRVAVEDVVHRGLGVLAQADVRGRVLGASGGISSGGACSPFEDPVVAREFVGLAHACLVTPLADGTRSSALSIAVAAFRPFRSHPDKNLATASEQALAGCGAILYPRAAPLHLPHAVTSQAQAWGASSVGSHAGLPVGWGGMLGDGREEDEGDGAVSDDAASNHMDVVSTSTTVEDVSPSLGVSRRATTKTSVVAPSSEAIPCPSGSSSANHGKSNTSVPGAVLPEEARDGGGALWKGKGRDRGAEAGIGATGATLATTRALDLGGGRGNVSATPAVAAVSEGVTDKDDGGVGDEASRRRTRSRDGSGAVDTAKSNISVTTADAAMDIQKHQAVIVPSTRVSAAGGENGGAAAPAAGVSATKSSLVKAPASRGGGGGIGGGQSQHEDDDDDGFEFPALVVDADPDE